MLNKFKAIKDNDNLDNDRIVNRDKIYQDLQGQDLPRFTGLTTPVGLLVTPTDRPKSVRNRCVIEVFGSVCVCCPLVFEFSVGIGGFVIGLGQISFFFSLLNCL